MNKITIKRERFNALLANQARNDVRYYLHGFHLDFDKAIGVATDGHALVRVPIAIENEYDDALPQSVILQGKEAPLKPAPRGCTDVTICKDEETRQWSLSYTTKRAGKMTLALTDIDGKFPDYERVIPKDKDSGKIDAIGFNPNLFARTSKALGRDVVRVQFSKTDNRAMVVTFGEEEPDVLAVVMPCRI